MRIHPEDRERALAAVRRAIEHGAPHDVEYRIVAPDGTIRWVEGKGRVEYEGGRPARMTGVCMMVTRRNEAELARVSSLEEANRLKDDFLATLSHELRTPLKAILGWVQLLETGGSSSDGERRAFDIISRNARLQAQLIEDILDSRESSPASWKSIGCRYGSISCSTSRSAALLPAAESKQIEIVREIATDFPAIEGDPKRLQQVFGNLLANAIKFTPDAGIVTVACHVAGDAMVIEVHDNGAGIAPDFLPFVFDRFRQSDSRVTRRHGGLGLGLAIARHLVEQHHGEIRAVSEGLDCGTTLQVRLPGALSKSYPSASPDWDQASRELRLDGTVALVVR